MPVNCSVQYVDSHPDVEELLGEVDFEKAIEKFNAFPWQQQLKKAEKREMSSNVPQVSFRNNAGKILKISTSNLEYFKLYYANPSHEAFFTLSRDVNQNKKGLFVEDFIEWFFTENIESRLKLRRKQENLTIPMDLDIKFKPQYQWKFAIPFITWFPVHLWVLLVNPIPEMPFLLIHVLLGSFWVIPLVLYWQYYLLNRQSTLTTSTSKKSLIYKERRKIIEFSPADVKYCEYVSTRSSRAPWNRHEYIRLILKDHQNIILTSVLGDVKEVLFKTKIHYKNINAFIPLILTRQKIRG